MAIITSSNFNIENVMFCTDIKSFGYGIQKIRIRYRNKENRPSSLYVVVPNVQSYGVQKNNFKNSSVDSYTLPLVMDDEPTNDVLEQILQKCKEHLNKSEVKQALKNRDLYIEGMDIFYRKPNKNGDVALKLYPKLETKFIDKNETPVNKPEITTKFFDSETNEPIDPATLINQRCKVRAAIKVGYICIAEKPSIQLYVREAIVHEKRCDGNKRLLWPT